MIDLNKYKNTIIAHRGIHDNNKTPENSLKAFSLAIDKKMPIELDIHLTKDNFLVVLHDDNLKRMTNHNIEIETLTLKEIKQYNLLDTTEKIPTLEEVLYLVNKKVLIDIEIKSTKRINKIITSLLNALENYQGEIIIKSFNPKIVKETKRRTNKYPVGLLLSTNTNKKLYNSIAKSNIFIQYSKPDFLALSKKLIERKNLQKYMKKIPILIWTIENKDEIIKINNKDFIYITNIKPSQKDK